MMRLRYKWRTALILLLFVLLYWTISLNIQRETEIVNELRHSLRGVHRETTNQLLSPFRIKRFPSSRLTRDGVQKLLQQSNYNRHQYFSNLETSFQISKVCSEPLELEKSNWKWFGPPPDDVISGNQLSLILCLGSSPIHEICHGIAGLYRTYATTEPRNAKQLIKQVGENWTRTNLFIINCDPEPRAIPWFGGGPCMGIANQVLRNSTPRGMLDWNLIVLAGEVHHPKFERKDGDMGRKAYVERTLLSLYHNTFPKFQPCNPRIVWLGKSWVEHEFQVNPNGSNRKQITSQDGLIQESDKLLESVRIDDQVVSELSSTCSRNILHVPYKLHQLQYPGIRCDGTLYSTGNSDCHSCVAVLDSFIQFLLNVLDDNLLAGAIDEVKLCPPPV